MKLLRIFTSKFRAESGSRTRSPNRQGAIHGGAQSSGPNPWVPNSYTAQCMFVALSSLIAPRNNGLIYCKQRMGPHRPDCPPQIRPPLFASSAWAPDSALNVDLEILRFGYDMGNSGRIIFRQRPNSSGHIRLAHKKCRISRTKTKILIEFSIFRQRPNSSDPIFCVRRKDPGIYGAKWLQVR